MRDWRSVLPPAGFDFTLIPVGMSAGTLTSPVYTLAQLRSVAGNQFSVGIDVNQAQQTHSLQSFQFNINGGYSCSISLA